MSRKRAASPPEEKGESAPLWMISFADMISLLMAFFVMLLTMSTEKSGQLCNEGEGVFEETVDGFRRTIDEFGLPGVFGRTDQRMRPGDRNTYPPISYGDERQITQASGVSEETMRRLFAKIQKQTRTYGPELRGHDPNFLILPVTFAKGQSGLNQPARQAVRDFMDELVDLGRQQKLCVYVVGLALDEPTDKQQWILSARRAQTVADYLRSSFPPGMDCRVFSWGASSGGDWVKQDTKLALQSQIAVAVLKTDS